MASWNNPKPDLKEMFARILNGFKNQVRRGFRDLISHRIYFFIITIAVTNPLIARPFNGRKLYL